MVANKLQRELKIVTDVDCMRASLRLHADEDYSALGESDVIRALEAAKVQVTPRVRDRVKEIIASMKTGEIPRGDVLVAEGTAPTDPRDAQFAFTDPPESRDPKDVDEDDGPHDEGAARVDFFEMTRIRMARAGQVLGRWTPSAPGTPGTDVLGRAMPPRRTPREITFGENVESAADSGEVRATADGVVHWARARLSVQPAVQINGNVDFESGSIDAPVSVVVRGDVLDSFHVRSGANVSINGGVGASEVKAVGDINVRGGIAGKEKGHIESQGRVIARFCDGCSIRAGGDLIIAKEAINSHLHAHGRILMPRGALIGGRAYARCGGEIKQVGSDRGIRTQVAVGVDPAVLDRCREIDEQVLKRREASTKIRQTVAPLMEQLKRLLPAQRERATELLYEADQIDAGIQELMKERQDILRKSSPEGEPFLLVSSRIRAGVTVIIGDLMTTFTEERKGPVKITRRKVDRVDGIVMVNELTASVTVLSSRDVRLKMDA